MADLMPRRPLYPNTLPAAGYGDMPFVAGNLLDEVLGIEQPTEEPAENVEIPGLDFLGRVGAGLSGMRTAQPRGLAQGLMAGIGGGLSARAQRQMSERDTLEKSLNERSKARDAANLQATRDYKRERADALRRMSGEESADKKAKAKYELENPIVTEELANQYPQFRRLLGQRITDKMIEKAQSQAAGLEKKPGEDEELGSTLEDQDLEMLADMFALTGQLPSLGFGKRGTFLREQIIKKTTKKYPGVNLGANRAIYTADRQALVGLQRIKDSATAFEQTALRNADVMLKAMTKIKDTGSPLFNRPLRLIDTQLLGSEEMAAFNVARQTVVPEFARILNSPTMAGQLTDTARAELEAIVRGDYSLKQMKSAIDILRTDAANRTQSYQEQINEIKGRLDIRPKDDEAEGEADFEYVPGKGLVPVGK